jgi:hypothetical protein
MLRRPACPQVADCPAYVSLAEALAFCRLHGARIMTEAEWGAARMHADSPGGSGSLVGLREGGWEWTSSLLEPLPGAAVGMGGGALVCRGSQGHEAWVRRFAHCVTIQALHHS